MPIVGLSTNESELYDTVLTTQGMMFVLHVILGMELQVQLHVVLFCDNNVTVDLSNNWYVGGMTRHVNVKQMFFRELEANGFLRVKQMLGKDLTLDARTKNVPGPLFFHCIKEFVS